MGTCVEQDTAPGSLALSTHAESGFPHTQSVSPHWWAGRVEEASACSVPCCVCQGPQLWGQLAGLGGAHAPCLALTAVTRGSVPQWSEDKDPMQTVTMTGRVTVPELWGGPLEFCCVPRHRCEIKNLSEVRAASLLLPTGFSFALQTPRWVTPRPSAELHFIHSPDSRPHSVEEFPERRPRAGIKTAKSISVLESYFILSVHITVCEGYIPLGRRCMAGDVLVIILPTHLLPAPPDPLSLLSLLWLLLLVLLSISL